MRTAAATLGRLPRAVAVVPRAVAGLPRLAVPGPHGRRRLAALLVLVTALAAAYTFWLRDSSLVRVEHVTVSGLGGADAARVQQELAGAARHMTTLDVDEAALRRAVAAEPIVQSMVVETDFPHGLRISIVQNRPVAMLVAGGREVAVAPDGTLLEGAKLSGSLPIVRVAALPGKRHLPDGPTLQRVFVAAAAPSRLLARVESISIENGRGVVAQLTHGPAIIFGGPADLGRKWLAAAAVLAQRSSQGATFIDVRMPDRPVAGGLGVQLVPQAQAEALAAGADPTVPSGTSSAQPAPTPAGATPTTGAPAGTAQAAPESQAAPAQTQPAPAAAAAPPPSATGSPSSSPSTSSAPTQARP